MKGQNFTSQVLSRHTFRIARKKGSDFFDHRGTLINDLQFQGNLSLYIINKLHHGKCFCTILYDIYKSTFHEAIYIALSLIYFVPTPIPNYKRDKNLGIYLQHMHDMWPEKSKSF